MVQKGNLVKFEKEQISETREAMPAKIGFHAYHINPYLHEFLKSILFFDPHGLSHGPNGNFGHLF